MAACRSGFPGNDVDGGLLEGSIQAERMIYRADINLTDILLNSRSGTTSLKLRSE